MSREILIWGGDLFKGAEKFKASNWSSNIDGIMSYSNVAIGKDVEVSSAYKLDVAGNVNISGDLYKGGSIFKASNWNSNVNGIASYSNVAIGKDVAVGSAYKLDVAGNIHAGNNSFLLSTPTSTELRQFFGKEYNGEIS